jgi:hypothetical protein
MSISLNSAAIDAILDSAGLMFAIGGSVTTLNAGQRDAEFVFGSSQTQPSTQRLDLTIVPEPSAFAIVATSLFAVSAIRRRR